MGAVRAAACLAFAVLMSLPPVVAAGGERPEPAIQPDTETAGSWAQVPRTGGPPPRMYFGLAYDSAHKKVVLFGGSPSSGPRLGDTWLYDPVARTWQNVSPSPSPSGRSELGMVYDASIDRVVLFGGFDTAANGETWHYDVANNTWTRVTTTGSPSARGCAMTMAYDSTSRRTILFGGYAGGYLGDTWSYDGLNRTWTNRAPSGPPSARCNGALANDPANRRTFLFGGSDGSSLLPETWAYDFQNNSWARRFPSSSPTGRSAFDMDYDPVARRIALFGGATGAGVADGQTWLYDPANNTWAQRTPSPAPPPRYRHSAVFASAVGQFAVFGGNGASDVPVYADLWSYNLPANQWTDLTPWPSPRIGHAMAYSPEARSIVLFGGIGEGWIYRSDTWLFNVDTSTWSNALPTIHPGQRTLPAMTYDSRIHRIILFGGYDGSGPLNEVWTYDGANNSWNQETVTNPPTGRWGAGFDFNPASGTSFLFGGQTASGRSNETWEYDSVTRSWTRVFPGISPSPRQQLLLVNLGSAGRMMLFGGNDGSANGETWILNSSVRKWTNALPTVSPSPRWEYPMTYYPTIGQAVLFGGWTGGFNGETWLYDASGNVWSNPPTNASPGPRSTGALAFDPVNQRVLLFGGCNKISGSSCTTGGFLADAWEFTAVPPGPRPRVIFTSPSDGAANVPVTSGVVVGFDQPMDTASTTAAFSIAPPVSGGTANVVGRNLSWSHTSPFSGATIYTVTIAASAKSAAGVPMAAPYTFKFATISMPPFVVSTAPANGTKGVSSSSNVIVAFDQAMDPVTAGAFSISPPVSNGTASVSGRNLTWSHSTAFTPNTTYQVTVSTLAKSAAGMNMSAPHSFGFTTLPVAPKVISTDPANGQAGVPLDVKVMIDFDLDMDAASTAAAFSISPAVAGGSPSVAGKRLTWSHLANFEANKIYTVTISTFAKSLYGDRLAAPYAFDFASGSQPSIPKVLETNPRNGDTGVPQNTSVKVTFDLDMDPSTTAAAFTISPPVAGGSLSVSGAVLLFTHPKPLEPLTLYTATISDTATSKAGTRMASPYSFIFITGGTPKPVDPARIAFTVVSSSLSVGESTDVYYNVYDADDKPIGTKDSWTSSPAGVADVTLAPPRHFVVKALAVGTLTISVTAQGDTKSVKNSTSIVVSSPDDIGQNTTLLGIIGLAIILAVLAAVGLIIMLRRKRPRAPAIAPFEGQETIVHEASPSTPPPEVAPAPAAIRPAPVALPVVPSPTKARRRPPPPPPSPV